MRFITLWLLVARSTMVAPTLAAPVSMVVPMLTTGEH